ncbi:MAG: hypothetical protein PVF49_03530 [Anaerolineales bacterium]|jgi:hypothetical protein
MMDQDAYERVRQVKETYGKQLMELPNVVGLGIGLRHVGGEPTGEVALVVLVLRKLPAASLDQDDLLPQEIDGVPVDVQEVGEISAS